MNLAGNLMFSGPHIALGRVTQGQFSHGAIQISNRDAYGFTLEKIKHRNMLTLYDRQSLPTHPTTRVRIGQK